MKLILIPVSDRPECHKALHQGFSLGQALGASVLGCHIRPHRKTDTEQHATTDSILVADNYDLAWEASLERNTTANSPELALALYEHMAEQYNYPVSKRPQATPCARWTEQVGSPNKLFSIMGPMADLVVVSRPAKQGQSVAKTIMLSAVLHAATPVLVLPQEHQSTAFSRIAIAWNQSAEASHAIKAAMPLLMQAKQVSIITHQTGHQLGPQLRHLQTYLSHWGVTHQHLEASGKSDTDAILDAYQESQSELLVMGGYSRSRLRQRLFGGVTENMLNDARIPVFMMHI